MPYSSKPAPGGVLRLDLDGRAGLLDQPARHPRSHTHATQAQRPGRRHGRVQSQWWPRRPSPWRRGQFLPRAVQKVLLKFLDANPDAAPGEAPEVPYYETNRGPGTTAEVDLWTSRDVREVVRSHVNYVIADTQRWEQSAAYAIDTHKDVAAFVKNAGLGFAIPYLHNGQPHDYMPDFLIRLKDAHPVHLILETKGYGPLTEVKVQVAQRWVDAVNADGTYGYWHYAVARKPEEITKCIEEATAKFHL